MRTLVATGAIFATWTLYAIILAGLGRSARQLTARSLGVPALKMSDFWVGLAVLVVWLQIWNFWFPVTVLAWLPVLAAAVLGVARGALIPARPSRLGVAIVGVFVVAAVWLANLAIQGPLHVDSAGYHLSMLQWVQEFPAVPGLANLHLRFGYNSSEFLYVAAMGSGPWRGQGYHVANGLLLLAALAEVAAAVHRIARTSRPGIPDLVLVIIGAAVIDRFANGFQLTSPAPDLPAFVVSVMMAVYLMRAVAPRADDADSAAAVALAAAAPLIRLQLLPMAVLALLILVSARWRGISRVSRTRGLKVTIPVFALVAVAWGSWMARGIVLSGYPLFPSTMAGVEVDWQVPADMAKGESESIRAFARDPGARPEDVLSGWGWLGTWWRPALTHPDLRYPLAVFGLALLLGGMALILRRPRRPEYSAHVAVAGLLPAAAATVVWFVTAPDPRFNAGPLWVLATSSLGLAAMSFTWRWDPPRWSSATVVTLGVACILWVHSLLVLHELGFTTPERATGDGVLGTIDAPAAELTSFRTYSGLQLNVPADGRCWSAPQPCTPMPIHQLRQRGADLSSGFTLGGDR